MYGLLLLAVLAIGFWLRCYPNNSGLPGQVFTRNDEMHYVPRAIDLLHGRPEIDYFINPSVAIYTTFAGSWLTGKVLIATGWFASEADFLVAEGLHAYWTTLAGRTISLLAALASIALISALGKRLVSPATGLLAALALATNRVHAERSVLVGNEALMVLLVLAFAYALVCYLERPTVWKHAMCGAALGLAVSTKYNAGVMLLPLLGMSFAAAWRQRPHTWSLKHWIQAKYSVGIPIGALFFFVGSPYAALRFSAFWRDFRTQSSYLHEGWRPSDLEQESSAYAWYLTEFPEWNNGFMFAAISGLGVLWCAWLFIVRRDARAGLILLAAVPLYLMLGSGTFRIMRFLLPAIPFVLLAGAWFTTASYAHLHLRFVAANLRGRWITLAWGLAILGTFVPHSLATANFQRGHFGEPDWRGVVYLWAKRHLDPREEYLELALESHGSFLNEHYSIARYRLESVAGSDPQARLRLDAFRETALRTTPLTRVLQRSPTLVEFIRNAWRAGFRNVLFVSGGGELRAARFEERAVHACPYWEDLILAIALSVERRFEFHTGHATLLVIPIPVVP